VLCASEKHDHKPILISRLSNQILVEINNLLEKANDVFNEI
jgi:hypothetical protein